jgi:hypothetical protein
MDKKPLIVVSLCAVVLLVLASLSNVVGYQSVKSTAVNDSPLFQTRTQRATNQQQNSITSQYLGMRKDILWQFPMRDNRTEQLRKVIDVIRKMGDKTFAQFTELCIQKARQDDTLRDLNRYEIVQALLLLKTNPEAIINSYTIRNNQDSLRTEFTQCGEPTWCVWGPGCLLVYLFLLPFLLLEIIINVIYAILTIVLTTANY